MKKILAAVVCAVAVAGPIALAAPADAANPPCITRKEFRRIHSGMTLTQVKRIVGSKGRLDLSAPPMSVRSFKTCAPWHVSNISLWSGRVQSKLYI